MDTAKCRTGHHAYSPDTGRNAARIKYHEIGIVGKIHKDNYIDIDKYIDEITNNKKYKKNIETLCSTIKNSHPEILGDITMT